jgi:hypothetical protein
MMSNQRKKSERVKNPLVVLYQVLCNAVFDDEYGANKTTYNALMILGAAIDQETTKDINSRIEERDKRFRYAE